MKDKKFARHGDISFHSISELPKSLNRLQFTGEYVLAEGETTGHKHKLVAEKDAVVMYQDEKGGIVLEIKGKALVTHEEHKTIELNPGIYKVGREQEYDYFSKEIIRVQD